MHKAGFVNIVGNPNVGKSTLSNILVGERLSIITSKAQTTRHRIMGIVNTDEYQIVFSDTPGVLKPKFKLQESMLEYSTGALVDADVLLYVTDVVETPTKNKEFLEKVAREKVPIILVINKIDLLSGQAELQCGPNHEAHRGTAARKSTLLRQRRPHRPLITLFRHRNRARENSAHLRQGSALRHTGDCGEIRRRRR